MPDYKIIQGITMDDYGYLNTRVRAMNRDLLKNEFFMQLLNQPELSNMVEALQDTPLYGEDISVALAESSGLNAVEKALRRNLSGTFGKVLHMSSGRPRALTCVLLNRWDLFNIKTILRGKQVGRPQEEIAAAFIPVGELDEPKLVELANQPDIKSVIDMLVTWGFHLASPISKALPGFMDKGDILGIEMAIDEFYFEWALKETEDENENSQVLRGLIIEQIDFANTLNTLKHLSEKLSSAKTETKQHPQAPPEPLGELKFIPGGKFRYSFLLSLSKCAVLEEALELLVNTKFSSIMDKAISAYTKTRKLSSIERFFEAFIAEKWSNLYKKDPLSISIIVGFLGRKLNEFLNIRIIARGKAHDVPTNIIKGELFFV